MNDNKWWGYVHENGSLHVKRFFDYIEDLSEAQRSPFVKSVHGPWKASSREEALKILAEELK
jgi:hypothetical protein